MNAADLPNRLRMLADQIEDSQCTGNNCAIQITVHGVEDRESLAKWARLMGENISVYNSEHGSYLQTYHWRQADRTAFCIHFPGGLLGGAKREIIEDGTPGLAALMREYSAVERVEAAK